jgi:hypothetical protein
VSPMLRAAALACALVTAGSTFAQAAPEPLTPPEHRRGEEQTYLTFPEWFLVHSPAEFAAWLQRDGCAAPPSGLPYFTHIGQFWTSYAVVSDAAAKVGKVNFGYHVMVIVIGTSTSVEYLLKGAYENTVGRLTEAARSAPVAEDCVAAAVAQDYVDFIRIEPWYRYDFMKALHQLWNTPPRATPPPTTGDAVRHWERRFALSAEYLGKAAYAWLIGLATGAAYDPALPNTVVVTDRDPGPSVGGAPEMKRLAPPQPDGATLVSLPRYQAFTPHAQALAAQGLNFREIAGNRGHLLASLWLREGVDAASVIEPPGGDGLLTQVLLEQPILTLPGTRRVLLRVPVSALAQSLRDWAKAGTQVEHLYDF